MTKVMNLGVPSWGSLSLERLLEDSGAVADDFLIPVPVGDRADDYFTFDEYARFSREFPSSVFFFSGSLFTFRVFSIAVKHLEYSGAVDAVVQAFVSDVHDNSLLPKSDKATKLAREIRPLRRILEDIGFDDVDSCRTILSYVLDNPVCPTPDTSGYFFEYAVAVKEQGAERTLRAMVEGITSDSSS